VRSTKPTGRRPRPTALDRLHQLSYRLAFRAALAAWFLRRPRHDGALLIVWHDERALLVRNSYHALWSAPGGSLKTGESPAEAAAREMREEVGIAVPVAELRLEADIEHLFRYRRDRVRIFAWDAPAPPAVAIDHREVVEAAWFTPEEALRLPLTPHLADVFRAGITSQSGPDS
jgi:8-oxo-dGTP diphosphatase